MLKRIWSIISDKDFYAFRERAKSEGLDMGEALAAIVHCYATGAPITLKPFKHVAEKLRSEGVDYVRDHRLHDVDASLTGGK